jgi:hypothetical protein
MNSRTHQFNLTIRFQFSPRHKNGNELFGKSHDWALPHSLKLTFSTGLLDESDQQLHMPVADVYNNNHISTVVLNAIDNERRCNVISDVTTKPIAIDVNVAEHSRNKCDIIRVCSVGQHTANGYINVHECNSRCCNSFQRRSAVERQCCAYRWRCWRRCRIAPHWWTDRIPCGTQSTKCQSTGQQQCDDKHNCNFNRGVEQLRSHSDEDQQLQRSCWSQCIVWKSLRFVDTE